MFFTPVISFNLGIFLDNFMLYKIPRNKGKKRIGSVITLVRIPKIKVSIKERTTVNFKIYLYFIMIFALSGRFIVSSFKSVNLFNPYTLKVLKNVNIVILMEIMLINIDEKRTLREPLIAKKSDVEIRNIMNLFNIEINLI